MIFVRLGRFKRCNLNIMFQLANNWMIVAFMDNDVPMSELGILSWLVTGKGGATEYKIMIQRLMPFVCKLTVTKGELPSVKGVVIIQDFQ